MSWFQDESALGPRAARILGRATQLGLGCLAQYDCMMRSFSSPARVYPLAPAWGEVDRPRALLPP
jgi:hypothetical protein